MSEATINLFGRSHTAVGNINSDFIIKTKGKVRVQWGSKFIDIIKDGKLNVDVNIIYRVKSKNDIGSADGIYITDTGEIYLVSGGIIYNLYGEAGSIYVAYIGDQDTTQEAKLQALKNIGIVYATKSDVTCTEGFVYIQDEQKFYTVTNGVLEEYPPKEAESDVLILDKRIITVLNMGEQILTIQDGIINIQAPIVSENTIKSKSFISNIYKSNGGSPDKGFYVETVGGVSTLYVDYLVVRKDKGIEEEQPQPGFLTGNTQYSYKRNYIISYVEKDTGGEVDDSSIAPDDYTLTLTWPQTYAKDDVIGIYTLKETEVEIPDPSNPGDSAYSNWTTEYTEVLVVFKVVQDSDGIEVTVNGVIEEGVSLEGKEVFLIQSNEALFTRYSDQQNLDLQEIEEIKDPNNPKEPIIHSRFGDITDYRTYNDKEWNQGIYSDQPVFAGGEFREPLNGGIENSSFPRYSESLNTELVTNHAEVPDGDPFERVMPTIGWIKQFGGNLNTPLKEINEANMGDPPTPPEYDDTGAGFWPAQ